MKPDIVSFLLIGAERLTHWLQINYDRDNFWLAKRLLVGGLILCAPIIALVRLHTSGISAELPVVAVVLGIEIFFALALAAVIGVWGLFMEKRARRSITKGFRNPYEPVVGLCLFLCLTVGLLMYFLSEPSEWFRVSMVSVLLVICVWFIFMAVTPLHPHEVNQRRLCADGAVPTK